MVVEGGDVDAIASAMARLALDPLLRERIGKRGYEYSRLEFDAKKNARAVEQIYHDLIQEHHALPVPRFGFQPVP